MADTTSYTKCNSRRNASKKHNFSPDAAASGVFFFNCKDIYKCERIWYNKCKIMKERKYIMEILYFFESIRNGVLDAFFSLITLGGEETVFMALGMIFFWCVNKYQGYYLLSVGFAGTILNQFLKMLFRVPRPWIKDPSFTIVESARDAATGYSFPSGHTQTSVGLFGGIALTTKQKWLRAIGIALTILVPVSRLYLGVHTPADVLVSTAIALILIFAFLPLFKKAENSPAVMYAIFAVFTLVIVAFICFVFLYDFPADVYTEGLHNLESARKNGFTLLGCVLGLTVVYTVDRKWINFGTKAVWWAQIIKVAGGLGLVLAVKSLLKSPLESLIGNEFAARSVRYFLMVIVAGMLWPLTFKFFSRLGSKK